MTDPTPSPSSATCPNCGSPIPDEAPHGLCPRCVLSGAATLPDAGTAAGGGGSGGNPAPPPEVSEVSEVASAFPDLEVEELVGSGGMGAVYRARQTKLDRPVALKLLSGALARDPAFAERFNREARVLARLNHPNIVTVFDFGTRGGFCFLLMEFVDGVNLRQAMHAGGFTPAESLALVQDICGALQFAHDEGVLHRDIKPENILIDSRGRVKIADFGIAKLIGEGARSSGDGFTLTAQGSVLGSPHYMAPEQIEHPGDVDQRADVYSLGVVFYELLTGELPIGRFSPPSEKSTADSRVDEVVMRALEKERQRRYQSAGEVRTSVEALTGPGSAAAAPEPPAPPERGPGTSATPADSTTAAPPEPGTARFATASAAFTGASLVLAGLVAVGLVVLTSGFARGHWASVLELVIIGGITLLFVVVPALAGFVLGLQALREIRSSQGDMHGVGRAMFGALAWPFLIAMAVLALGAGMGFAALLGPGVLWLVAAAALCTAAGTTALVGAWRWARALPRGDRSRRAGPVAMVTGILSFVTALTVLVPWGALTVTQQGRVTEPRQHPVVTHLRGDDPPQPESDTTPWRYGNPEIELLLQLPAGHVATVRLVHRDAGGSENPLALEGYAIAADDRPFDGRVKIGSLSTTAGPDRVLQWLFRFEQAPERRTVTAAGSPQRTISSGGASAGSTGTLPGTWRFDASGIPNRLDLATPGEHSFVLASGSSRTADPNAPEANETLVLNVTATRRDAPPSVSVRNPVIGSGTSDWRSRLERP